MSTTGEKRGVMVDLIWNPVKAIPGSFQAGIQKAKQCFLNFWCFEFGRDVPKDFLLLPFAPSCPSLCSGLSARFGQALSKARALHAKRNVRRARRFIRQARNTTNQFNLRPRVNRAWVAGANLQPVLDFLASKCWWIIFHDAGPKPWWSMYSILVGLLSHT